MKTLLDDKNLFSSINANFVNNLVQKNSFLKIVIQLVLRNNLISSLYNSFAPGNLTFMLNRSKQKLLVRTKFAPAGIVGKGQMGGIV